MPGMPEAGAIERILVDRVGDHGGGLAGADLRDRDVDRADHQRRVGGVGAARCGARRPAYRQHRQRLGEHLQGVIGGFVGGQGA
jgi:hypothetical protein